MISNTLTEHSARVLEYALEYAKLGWGVIPLCYPVDGQCSCGRHEAFVAGIYKKGDCSPGKATHYRLNGSSTNATTDPDSIKAWFQKEKHLNIGVVAGVKSNLVMLDVDPDKGGDASLERYKVPQTLEVITGGGGRHFYFAHPGGNVRNSAGTLGPGLDVRGKGGYVVAPPSMHSTGNEYCWKVDPIVMEPVACPTWLLNGRHKETVTPKPTGDIILEGQRDDTLIRIAGTLRQVEGLGAEAIYEKLSEINRTQCSPPLEDAQVRKLADSAAGYPVKLAGFPRTDTGAAQIFAHLFADKFKYDHSCAKWLTYDGKKWDAEKGEPAARRYAVEGARKLREEALQTSGKERASIEAYARRLESTGKINATLKESTWQKSIEAYASDFDTDPMLLNCLNGTLDLKTGKLRQHNPDDKITKICPVEYDPDATSELWDRFLDTVTEGETEFQTFLQRACGYSLTGEISEEVLFFVHGDTATGKSTFLKAMLAVFGNYGMTSNFKTFLKTQHSDSIRVDLANMAGSRLVVSSEVDEGKSLAEAVIKSMTGGEKIRARFLFRNEFEYQPQFTLWLAANHAPRINDADAAMWRRILRVPFENTIAEDERDPEVKRILSDPIQSGPAILRWAVDGCLLWQKHGLEVPDIVKAATQELREEMDPLKDFFEDRCVFGAELSIPVSALRREYDRWAQEYGIKHTISAREFNKRVRAKGCLSRSSRWTGSVCKCWHGVGLTAA